MRHRSSRVDSLGPNEAQGFGAVLDYHEIKIQFRQLQRFPQEEYVRAIVFHKEYAPTPGAHWPPFVFAIGVSYRTGSRFADGVDERCPWQVCQLNIRPYGLNEQNCPDKSKARIHIFEEGFSVHAMV